MRASFAFAVFLAMLASLSSLVGCIPESQAHGRAINGVPVRSVLTTRYPGYTPPPEDDEPEPPAERIVHLNPGGAYGAPAAPNLPPREAPMSRNETPQ